MKNRFLKCLVAASLLVFHLPATAEDIDLFVGLPPSAADAPNVLIILDNTANWNTAFTNEIAALKSVVENLPVNTDGTAKFRVGLMLFTESGGGNSGPDGGYVRAAVRPLNGANKIKYSALLNSLHVNDDKSNGGKLGNTMADAYYYFSGAAPYTGNNKVKTDYNGNTSGTAASNAVYALPGNALSAKAGSPYLSPVVPGSCAKNFIIYISNGAAQDNNADIAAATTQLSNAASAAAITNFTAANATSAIPISPSGSQDNVGDEWTRFMKKSALGITTYTVDIDKVTSGQGPGWTALLKSMANVSKGKYFDVSSAEDSGQEISNAINNIFSEIQSVNSVFAAVSLPVSVNTQGTYLNQVFVGMFRPDAGGFPRWDGNLKQYKLGYLSGTLKLLDAGGNGAISSGGTGFIAECARSFWTPTAVDTYWTFKPQGACLAVANSDVSNTPDGNIVEKGAQAYKLRSTTTRTVKTCSPVFSSCTALTDFNNTNVNSTDLGAASAAERDALINWEKGLDVDNENLNAATTTEIRPSAHGDVVHSRPVAINFGTDVAPQVVVFYGGNDGVLRAVNGNRDGGLNVGGKGPGMELWAFVAPEFYPHIKRIRDNTTPVSYFGNTTCSPEPCVAPERKPYGFDGAITAYKDASHAWIYATMRRGGRALYAFDVTLPASPTLKWKKGCPNQGNDTDCTAGFSGIGQTWSAPKIMKASGYDAGTSPMLIMGGGYDNCEDSDPHACTPLTKGNKIYVLNADTGALLKTLDTDRGVVADLFVVPDSATGLAKFAYAADLGGNVYRINIGADAPADWTITKIASLGGADAEARKFMFTPDVLEDNGKYVLLLGSGDREKPLTGYASASNVSNYFFMLKDDPSDAGWLASEAVNCGGSAVICKNSLFAIAGDATPTLATVAEKKGWYLALNATEQVVTSAITVFGTVTFSTHQPAVPVAGACSSNLGTARVYNISYANAASMNGTASRWEVIVGGGLPPSPVAGSVTLDGVDTDGDGDEDIPGATVPFVIGADPDSPLEGGEPPAPPMANQPKSRVYWYIQQ